MSKEQQKIVDDFVDLITDEMESCIEKCESINELKRYHNILIVCSAKNQVLHLLVKQLVSMSENMRINVLGNEENCEFLANISRQDRNIQCHNYTYEGRFDANRIMPDRDVIMRENPSMEAIIFLNYDPHAESYLNVEEAVEVLSEDKTLSIYAYNVLGDLYKYIDIRNHRNSIDLYSRLVQWYHVN